MARNGKQPGVIIPVTLAAAATSGELIKVGDLAGVALHTGGIGDTIEVAIDEVFEVAKLSTDNMGQGVTVYLDATNKRVTLADAAGANIAAGKTTKAAAGSTTVVEVKLNA